MDLRSTQHPTQRECQRHIFIDSLYRELDKVAAKTARRNSVLESKAERMMLEEGLSEDACVDMLVMEGFDPLLSRHYAETLTVAGGNSSNDGGMARYNYAFEDHRGRIFTGRELGDVVEAETHERAQEIVEEILGAFDPPVRLIDVSKIS